MAFCANCGSPVTGQFCGKCGARVGEQSQPAAPGVPPPSQPAYQPAAAAQGAAAPKKRGPLFWILSGCLGLIAIACVVFVLGGYFLVNKVKQAGFDPELMQKNPGLAVAKLMAATNPEIEVLGVDEDRGVIRVRNKKTGEKLTVSFEDAKNGRIVFMDDKGQKVEIEAHGEGDRGSFAVRSSEGTMTIGAGAVKLPDWLPSYPGAEETGTFAAKSNEAKTATYAFKTADPVEKVAKFYEEALKRAGLEVQNNLSGVAGQGGSAFLSAGQESTGRSVQMTILTDSEGTKVSVTFQSRN